MAILVRVLTLLACGPLLVPPGICVCKAGEPACTDTHPVSASPPHSTHRCSHHTADPSPDSVPVDPPGQDNAPAPHDHAPGCPAALSVEQLQRVEATADAGLLPVFVEFVGVFVSPVTHERRPTDRSVAHCYSPPPLYLTHCSLVI